MLGIPTDLDDPQVADALSEEGLARAREDLTLGPDAGADAASFACDVTDDHALAELANGAIALSGRLFPRMLDSQCQAAGVLVRPTCTYVQDYLERFPQYRSAVAD